MTSIMFFLARNSLCVTSLTSKEKALQTYDIICQSGIGANDRWELCRRFDDSNQSVIQQLN